MTILDVEGFMRFNGKSAIVTGAASGIGKHLALAFAREAPAVAVADLIRRGRSVAAEIEAVGGSARCGDGRDR